MAAKAAGKPCPDYNRMHEGFKLAYTEMARKYPCFGFAAKMPTIEWWRICVKDSFVKVNLFLIVLFRKCQCPFYAPSYLIARCTAGWL
jgi:hypothetical protein